MASLSHILASEPEPAALERPLPSSQPSNNESERQRPPYESRPTDSTIDISFVEDNGQYQRDNAPQAQRKGPGAGTIGIPTGNADKNGAAGGYPANKMRHLKKEDGIPLWRKDIQYEFLRHVFYNKERCFTKYSEKKSGFTFAEVYIDAMAKSSKCSKILKEKLLSDTDGAISMAMVCLLVNLGRMNTTLNFFPEMRAQLRTYHSIPALQANQDPNAYKQLQDAPRLKSILKGATEDEPQPWSMDEIKSAPKPRTNAVNLIFIMSQGASKITDLHFNPPRDFFDLIMKANLSSESRAQAFLWLLWWYLESDFTLEDSQNNPFGKGQYGENGDTSGLPIKVPPLEPLTEEQAELENVDTEEEKLFGEVKRKARIAILASDPSPAMVALKRARKGKVEAAGYRSEDDASEAGWFGGDGRASGARRYNFETDSVHTRSPSPAGSRQITGTPDVRIRALLNNEESVERPANPVVKKGPGRGNWRRNRGRIEGPSTGRAAPAAAHLPLLASTTDATPGVRGLGTPASGVYSGYSSFPIHGASPGRGGLLGPDHVPTPSYQAQKRHRGVTQHQSALISHRRAQMDYMLDRSIRRIHVSARHAREREGSMLRAWKRMRRLPADYDSEEEMIKSRKGRDRDKDDDGRGARGAKDDENVDLVSRNAGLFLAGFAMSLDDGDGDVGEEARNLAGTLRKASRRLDRWQEQALPGDAMIKRLHDAKNGGSKRRRPTEEDEDVEMLDDDVAVVDAGQQGASRAEYAVDELA